MSADKIPIYKSCPKETMHDMGISSSTSDKFCWSCGSELVEFTCACSDPACGKPAASASRHCTRCGKPTVKRTLDGKEYKREEWYTRA